MLTAISLDTETATKHNKWKIQIKIGEENRARRSQKV